MRRPTLLALTLAGGLLALPLLAPAPAVAHDPGAYRGAAKLHGFVLSLPNSITIQLGPAYPRHGYRPSHKGYGAVHHRKHRAHRHGPTYDRQGYKHRRHGYRGGGRCYEVPARGYGRHRLVCPGGFAYKPYARVPHRHGHKHRHWQRPPRYSWY